jgi:hypothetical protein
MNIFQTIQICNDIKKLYKNKGTTPFIPFNYNQFYQIRTHDGHAIVESQRREKYLSPTEFVPVNFWTNLFNIAGNHATVPLEFTVVFNNNGLLPHAPMEQDLRIHGLPARLIYNRMRKEFLADWHKQIGLRR